MKLDIGQRWGISTLCNIETCTIFMVHFDVFQNLADPLSSQGWAKCNIELLWLRYALIREVLPLLFLLYFFILITRIDHNFCLLKDPTEESTTLTFGRAVLLGCITLMFHLYLTMESGVSVVWSVKYQSLLHLYKKNVIDTPPSLSLSFSEILWMQTSTLTQKIKECISTCLHITSLSY